MARKKTALQKAKEAAQKLKGKKKKSKKPSYVSQGQNPPQSKAYTEAADRGVGAKPVGWRWTTEGAARLKKTPSSKPSGADIEKYKNKTFKKGGAEHRYLYSEKRVDKSDYKKAAKFAGGGGVSEKAAKKRLEEIRKEIRAERISYGEIAELQSLKKYIDPNDVELLQWANDNDEYAKGGRAGFSGRQYDPYNKAMDGEKTAKPVGYRFTDARADKLGKSPYARPTKADIEKYSGKGVYWEGRQDKSDMKPTTSKTYASFAKGGFSGRQYNPYNKAMDGEKTAKPVGYRFTDKLAKRLGVSPYKKPTAEEIDRYLGRGIYWEGRQDKSDLKPTTSRTYASFAKGGFSGRQYNPYNKAMDGEKTAKPVGYRFTDKRADKLGKSPYARPTKADIEKYSGKGVYWEGRQDKSDMKPTTSKTYASFARGGSPRISNQSARTYSENMLPFKANNLEGKTLSNGDYAVLSYGWYPLWYYSKAEGKWYGNATKYSVSTTKQMSQSRPTYDATMVSRNELDNVMFKNHAKFMGGGELDVLGDTANAPMNSVNGSTFSQADLTAGFGV